ncbi:MAG: diaminopimelate epimerase [Alphaproteobacteria bacterium]
MHGLGNDFVVFDGRAAPLAIGPTEARAVADRHTGVGCDQLVVMEPPHAPTADVFMTIRNADGGEVSACGNATRCVGALLMAETGRDRVIIETRAGLLDARRAEDGLVSVDMGPARLDWREIPLAVEMDTLHLHLGAGPLADPVGVSMGNPHAVFFVADAEAVDLARFGPPLEHDPLFPERANIEVVQVLGPARLRMRVWERGSGITRACGTGACAAVVAAARRGLAGRRAAVVLDGGTLTIDWRDDGRVLMTGPARVSFTGVLDEGIWS